MNIHAAAVLFVIGCTPPSVFSSDVAGRHRQRALQSKKASGGGINGNSYSPSSTAIDRCIEGFIGTYTYAADCNGVAFMASLGCNADKFCTYSESQVADMAACPDSEIRPPSGCVLSGSFDATEHVDPRTCEVKVFKLSGENCNYKNKTPTGVRINPNELNDDESIGIYFERMDNDPKILSSTTDDIKTRRLEQNFVAVLYSKSVDDHRYLANGDVTTEDKMKILDVHRRRLQCAGNCKVRLDQRYLADPSGQASPSCRRRDNDCTRFDKNPNWKSFCENLKFCDGCLKDSDCEAGGFCTNTGEDLEFPNSLYTMCVSDNCRPTNGRPKDLGYTTCGAVNSFVPMPESQGKINYNPDCCGNKECIFSPAGGPFVQPPQPEYDYCGDVCIKRRECKRPSAHTQNAQNGDGDFFCCSNDVAEQNWKDGDGDKCERRAGQGGGTTCDPGVYPQINCKCAPLGGRCRGLCPQEDQFCKPGRNWWERDCPKEFCCVGSECNPYFERNNIYTE